MSSDEMSEGVYQTIIKQVIPGSAKIIDQFGVLGINTPNPILLFDIL